MPLTIPDGAVCLVDSNILYYALVPTAGISSHCISFLNRAISGNISIAVSVPILSDTLHKIMMAEVAQICGRDRAGLIAYLGKHPEIIKHLVEYPQAMDRLRLIPMDVLPVDSLLLPDASALAIRHGLLTNDAAIIALMNRHNLIHLVTNDDDFDCVPGIAIWKPR